jgi:natural resistance-associated macrophage protein
MTEIAIIGSDIQEVVGSAIAFKILTGLPLWAGCLVTGLDTFTFLGLQQFGQRKLEAFFASLIFVMAVCFWMNYALDQPPSGDVAFGTFVPTAAEYTLVQAVGILGAVIMPHNIYLHSALVQSRKVDRTNERAVATANKYNAIESSIALAVSFVINLAVVGVFAHAFFDKSCAEQGLACVPLTTAGVDLDDDSANACMVGAGKGVCNAIGLSKAGDALKSSLGAGARIVWAVGVLAAGQASTMTGTLAGQYVMDGFLELKIPAWQRVLVTRCIALGPAIAVALGTGDSDVLDEWLNVLQSVQLPFALLPVLHFTSRQDLMGSHANSITTKLVCWALAVVVIITNFYLTGAQVIGGDKEPSYFYAISVILALLYLAFIAFLVKSDFLTFLAYAKTKIF